MSYYSVFPDDSYQEYEKLSEAVAASPEFIIEQKYRGRYDQTFPERRVIDDHFYISFYNQDGSLYKLAKNGWKVLLIDDPVRYNSHIHIKIADPKGDIRIFDKFRTDCHYEIIYRNTIDGGDGLIRFYRYFQELSNLGSWAALEKEKYENIPPSHNVLGNLHKYYYDVDTKTQPNLNKKEDPRNTQSNNQGETHDYQNQRHINYDNTHDYPEPEDYHDKDQEIIDSAFDGDAGAYYIWRNQ